MTLRAVLCTVRAACAAASSQALVFINFAADDSGVVWVNGQQIAMDSDFVSLAPIHAGRNPIAAYNCGHCWTDGLCPSMELGSVGVLGYPRTDSSWKTMDYSSAADGWKSDTAFHDSRWMPVGDYGTPHFALAFAIEYRERLAALYMMMPL